MTVVQNSFRGIWSSFAKMWIVLASSFAELSWNLFSQAGQLGVSTWIPTFEGPTCRFGSVRLWGCPGKSCLGLCFGAYASGGMLRGILHGYTSQHFGPRS